MGFLLSSSFWFSVLASTTPVMLATLAANIVSQAGIFNLAIEGTMLICALAGVLGSAWTGNLLVGAVAGLFFGILVSFILGYFTLVMRGPMNACGVAINLAATGGTVFVLVLTAGSKITSSALVSKTFPNVKIPGLSAIPFIGKVLSGQNFLTYVGWILVAVTWFLLYKTKLGLNIRAVGENEEAAQDPVHFAAVLRRVLCAGRHVSFHGFPQILYRRYGGGQRIPVSGDAGHQPGQSGGGLLKLPALWIFGHDHGVSAALQ